MAGNTEGQDSSTTPVSKRFINWALSVSATASVGAAIAIFSLYADSVRHTEQIKQLMFFGPETGARWTEAKAVKAHDDLNKRINVMREWMLEMQKSMNEHHAKGEHAFAGRRLDRIELWMRDHEKRLKAQGKIGSHASP